jgi:hypothetical protein
MSFSKNPAVISQADNPFGTPQLPARKSLLNLWLGIEQRVSRGEYAASGIGLALFKYVVEAAVVWRFGSAIYMPWHFINPLISIRTQALQTAPEWVSWALFVWTLPFLWIAVSMSVRRAADAGLSPWVGLFVLVPVANLIFMLIMCFLPSSPTAVWIVGRRQVSMHDAAKSAMLAIGASLFVGATMMLVSIYLLSSYGAALFLGTPIMMGATAAYLHNRNYSRSYLASAGLGFASVLFASAALLLFALEGAICIAMAIPFLMPVGVLGGIVGKAIADATRRPYQEILAALVCLPLFAGAEALLMRTTEYELMSAVEINATSATVWTNVVDFREITEQPEWYFRYGIACPQRARIDGVGVGAIRYCEFTTGTFVEPITVWDAPRRLAFDVTDQPAPMFELSPYRHVHPPHLHGFLRSNRGEFRLIPLADGRTRLEGRTWYEFAMFPQSYWTLWSDMLIHRIHERVLNHIKRESERNAFNPEPTAT